MALSLKTTIVTQNGMYGLIRNGLAQCDYGFGHQLYGTGSCREIDTYETWKPGYLKNSMGGLSYTPALHGVDMSSGIAVVTELGDLLTGGRLGNQGLQFIVEVYNSQKELNGIETALRVALQLVVTSPEFHTTGLVNPSSTKREPVLQPESNDEPYKAVLYIHLFGGLDSYYMLSPHPSCEEVYAEYIEARGASSAALLEDDMIEIDATGSEQPCSKFGLNKNLPIFKEIYDAGHGQFLANGGHLTKPVTKYK